MKSVYLIIAHGSRDSKANQAFLDLLEDFRATYSHRDVEPAFLELCKPSIPEALEKCVKEGAKEIFIFPLMFFPGRHVKEDIPRLIQEFRAKHLDVDFHYGGPLSEQPELLELIEKRLKSFDPS